ncbi:hypothetical protein R3P38DRAFT_1457133 [Favolaschia claudopus]|uniref:Uncharacterized protein n=1 Tax=Favolaschia claudopus TaxID=2862362 RepID=A0AAW0ALI8_9AGAR
MMDGTQWRCYEQMDDGVAYGAPDDNTYRRIIISLSITASLTPPDFVVERGRERRIVSHSRPSHLASRLRRGHRVCHCRTFPSEFSYPFSGLRLPADSHPHRIIPPSCRRGRGAPSSAPARVSTPSLHMLTTASFSIFHLSDSRSAPPLHKPFPAFSCLPPPVPPSSSGLIVHQARHSHHLLILSVVLSCQPRGGRRLTSKRGLAAEGVDPHHDGAWGRWLEGS